jgi:hypothetical protein
MSIEFKCTIYGRVVNIDVSEEALKEFIKNETGRDMERLKPVCGVCMNRAMVGSRHLSKN